MRRTVETASQRVEGPFEAGEAKIEVEHAVPDVWLDQVSKRFGEVVALRPTDLAIRRGEFFSLLGSSGSGKTTTLRVIAGFEQPDSGRVFLQNQEVTNRAPYERNLNTVFQDYALFPHMSVEENIGYGLRVRRLKKREISIRVNNALELVRLPGYGRRRPAQLSGGQRQRVALARALVNSPAVLLLDEPLGALDLKLRREMQEELKRIQRDVGITFIYVTHDQEEAMSMSDRVAVMSDGRILQVGTPTDVYEHPADAFIAGFVGISNLLPALVKERDGELLRLDCPGCDFLLLPATPGVAVGDEVLAAVRPEKITMNREPVQRTGRSNVLRGSVVTVGYGGAFTCYGIKVGDAEIAVVEQNEGEGPRAQLGEEVWLKWRPEQTSLLPGSMEEVKKGHRATASVE